MGTSWNPPPHDQPAGELPKTKTVPDWVKWSLCIVISFSFGALGALTDHGSAPMDYARHGGLTLLPTVGALLTKLKSELGI